MRWLDVFRNFLPQLRALREPTTECSDERLIALACFGARRGLGGGILTDGRWQRILRRQFFYRLSEDSVVIQFADGPDIGKQILS